ncbi:MAG TPA: FAD-dependent oxidoreductase [Cellvibrionaceae bacterium]
MTNTRADITLDIAIVGGGIAGLWLLDRLRTQGVSAALFSQGPLGAGQTIASQGMIHGGIKYTLNGALNDASQTIATMPERWRRCLAGTGEVDLSRSRVLSDNFYLWSTGSIGKLAAFFASRAVQGRITAVANAKRPALLQHQDFRGAVYRLAEQVIDVPGLLANLAANNRAHIFQAETPVLSHNSSGEIQLHSNGQSISAKQWVLTAGSGNAALLSGLGSGLPAMQLRPLKQVVVRHQHPHAIYGHCLGASITPRISFSSHPAADGSMVWYLGGALAEKGAELSDDRLMTLARQELDSVFPWLDFSAAEFSTLSIDRAEPRQADGNRPDDAFAEKAPGLDSVIVAWPTKLALAPLLADKILGLLHTSGSQNPDALTSLAHHFPHPLVASLPWETN